MDPQEPQDYNKPVAYDEYGRPLYVHPPSMVEQRTEVKPSDTDGKPQVVYVTRAISPLQQEVPSDVKQKHDESVRKYPQLNLSDGEYVISAVSRHPIGIISIWFVIVLAILMILAISIAIVTTGLFPFSLTPNAMLSGGAVLFLAMVLLVLGGAVATVVYDANCFYVTNECVVQFIQTSLFSKKHQTISLGNIEDASFRQKGILQTILNYGSIRLSTEGEETTYRFTFVTNPQNQTRILNDAIEAFKNLRPLHELMKG